MVKAIYRFFKNLYEKEIDYEITLDFSIYDVILGAAVLILCLWMLLR